MPQTQQTDLLYGVVPIAEHLSLTKRQVLHLHERRLLRDFKMDRTVCARRSSAERHFVMMERGSDHGERN